MSSLSQIHVLSRGVILKDDHILLGYNKANPTHFYHLPGGHVECGESVTDALLREIKEELALDAEVQRFLGVLEYTFDPTPLRAKACHAHEYNFIFQLTVPSLDTLLSPPSLETHMGFDWVPLETLPRTTLLPAIFTTLVPQWLAGVNSFESVMEFRNSSLSI